MSELMERGGGGPLRDVLLTLLRLDQTVDDAVRVDRIRLLEEIKAAAAAAQAVETAAFAASQVARQAAAGVPVERQGRGVAAQVALARRISPYEATRYVGQARILTTELPESFAVLRSGRVPEWRVLQVAQQTAWLSRENRAVVDAEIAPELERLVTAAPSTAPTPSPTASTRTGTSIDSPAPNANAMSRYDQRRTA